MEPDILQTIGTPVLLFILIVYPFLAALIIYLINCNFIDKPEWTADVVETAFRCRFGQ